VALLRREARLVRKLSHPRIVPVYGLRSGSPNIERQASRCSRLTG
jgi:hypothetical protein